MRAFTLLLTLLLSVSVLANAEAQDLRPDEIVTVLPKDAIPAIVSPSFEAGRKIPWLKREDFVVGVEIPGIVVPILCLP